MSRIERQVRQRCECGFIGTEKRMAQHVSEQGHESVSTFTMTRDRTEHKRAQKRSKPKPKQPPKQGLNADLEQKLRALRTGR